MKYEGILRKHIFARGVYEDVKMYAIIKDDFESLLEEGPSIR